MGAGALSAEYFPAGSFKELFIPLGLDVSNDIYRSKKKINL